MLVTSENIAEFFLCHSRRFSYSFYIFSDAVFIPTHTLSTLSWSSHRLSCHIQISFRMYS
nr:MAG TPA: hypothetical protein [Caudoviricetes sp.]